ncbi:MAG TPA: hypothetical protein VIM71_01570 [Lacunisphaera sp.]
MKWLKFILDNAWTVVIIGGVLVQLIQAIRKKQGGEETPAAEQPKEYQFDDPELAERTRKIREEIQRKIEQRTRGHVEPPVSSAEPVALPPVIREVTPSRTPVHASSRLDAQRQAEILEEQAALMERLREAEFMKAAGKKRIEFEAATSDHSAEARTATRSTVLNDLESPAALRRAFILREVLGPPVALKR